MFLDKYKAILWDNDGTLVDTERIYLHTTQEIFAEYDLQVDWEQVMQHVLNFGQSPFDFVRDQYALGADLIAKIRHERNQLFTKKLETETIAIMPGIQEALAHYFGKVHMAIVTSSERASLEIIMARTGLGRYFDFAITQDDVKILKPDPESYNLAISKLAMPAADVIAIEDTERGLVAAKKAGIACVVIPNRYVTGADYGSADLVCETAYDLLT